MLKQKIRAIFAPILNILESDTLPFAYKASHRIVLKVMGILFSGLATLVFWFAQGQDPGYFLPVIIFGIIGCISLLVGFLGTDRAVAKCGGLVNNATSVGMERISMVLIMKRLIFI